MGSDSCLERPDDQQWSDGWDSYLHQRRNREGPARDLWYHEGGCGAWLIVERDTATHAIAGATLAAARG